MGNKRKIMPNTYTQIYVQIVFTVKGRESLISNSNREELHKYIAGMLKERSQKLLAVFCMPDHIHILVSIKPSLALSDLVKVIKTSTSAFINEKKWVRGKFSWQEGYGAFSYSKSQVDNVIKYILNQEEHHAKRSFKDEYLEFLKKFDVEYEEKYLFEWIDRKQE